MSNYTKTTNFATKDSLPSGDANKIVKGAEINTEFDNIATAVATKANLASPTFTGTVTIPTADINGGTIDGTTIGGTTAGAVTATTLVANTSLNIASDGATVTGIKDEDDMASNSATKLATQQSIKAYVDSQVTAQDLDITTDSGTIAIDLDSETLTITGGTGLASSATGNAVTLDIDSTVATLTGTQTLTNKTLTSPDVNTPDIDGGTIDGTVIGGTTPAAVSATTVSATGNITVGGTVDGRDVATDGTKLDGIEAGATADQTAGEIKTAYESNADTNAFTDADHTKLDGIEANADVTDTANVTAAGALMDSELTSEASVKALNQGVATTDSPSFAGLTVDTDTLSVDATNNRVGIGTTSPSGKIQSNAADSQVAVMAGGDVSDPLYPAFGFDGQIGSNGGRGAGMYLPADGTLAWSTSGSERMRIDSSGRLGIGTSSPATSLTVAGSGANGIELDRNGTDNTQSCRLFFDSSTNGYSVFNNGGALAFCTGAVPNSTSGTEKLRIDSSGNVGIGTSSPTAPLHVSGGGILGSNSTNPIAFTGSGGQNAGIGSYNANTDFNIYSAGTGNIKFLNGSTWNSAGQLTALGTERMRIDSSGNVGIGTTSPSEALNVSGNILATGNITAYSDARLKENVEPIDNALNKVEQISGNTYTRNDLEDTERRYAGVIAQEVETVLPEAVKTTEDGTKVVDYNATIALLIEAVKELKSEVDVLKGGK